jgi:Tfp pilus assembly protein PilN
LGGSGRRISEFEASLVYKVSSKTARATQRNPVLEKQQQQQQQQQQKHPKPTKQTNQSHTVTQAV